MAEKRLTTRNGRLTSRNESFDFDLIVLGAGSAGIACAKSAAKLNAKVAYFKCADPSESDNIPDLVFDLSRKLMYESALIRDNINDSASYGFLIPQPVELDWKKYVQVMKKHTAEYDQTIIAELKASKIEYFNAFGYLKDEHTIGYIVEQETENIVTGKFILLAAFGHPILPSVPGSELGTTRNNIFNLKKPPGNTLVVGSNYSSLEIASYLRLLSYDPMIITDSPILPDLDQQMVEIILDGMSRRGIVIFYSHSIQGLEKSTHGRVSVDYLDVSLNEMRSTVFDTVIWALGNQVDISKFRCEAIGIKVQGNQVIVDKNDRTSISNIFAIGDICSNSKNHYGSVISLAGHLLARRLFLGVERILNYTDFSATILSIPQYGFIGMTESDAIEKYGEDNVEVYHAFYRPTEYYVPKRSASHCYVKVITLLEGDEPVLGIHFLGPYAGTVIQGYAVAIGCGLNANIMFHTITIHPTVAAELGCLTITKRSELDPNPNIPCS